MKIEITNGSITITHLTPREVNVMASLLDNALIQGAAKDAFKVEIPTGWTKGVNLRCEWDEALITAYMYFNC